MPWADSQQEWSHKDKNILKNSVDCWRVGYLGDPARAGRAGRDDLDVPSNLSHPENLWVWSTACLS